MLFFGGNYTHSREFLRQSGAGAEDAGEIAVLAPRAARARAGLIDLDISSAWRARARDLNVESRYAIDSFPVPACDNIRLKGCRLTEEFADREQFRGYIASKRHDFYGVRVQVLATVSGVPVEFVVMPGAPADLQGLAELPLSLPAGAARGARRFGLRRIRMGRVCGAN
jgi:hypothetical protein